MVGVSDPGPRVGSDLSRIPRAGLQPGGRASAHRLRANDRRNGTPARIRFRAHRHDAACHLPTRISSAVRPDPLSTAGPGFRRLRSGPISGLLHCRCAGIPDFRPRPNGRDLCAAAGERVVLGGAVVGPHADAAPPVSGAYGSRRSRTVGVSVDTKRQLATQPGHQPGTCSSALRCGICASPKARKDQAPSVGDG